MGLVDLIIAFGNLDKLNMPEAAKEIRELIHKVSKELNEHYGKEKPKTQENPS